MENHKINLQLFADGAAAGGEAGDGGAAAADTGVTAPDAGEQLRQPHTSRQAERARRRQQKREAPLAAAQDPTPDAAAEQGSGQTDEGAAPGAEAQAQTGKRSFEELIKGEYKQEFDQRVQDILRKRFRDDDARKERDGKVSELLITLAELTGQKLDDAAEIDPDQLRQALLSNEGIVDAAAMEAGVGTDQYLQQLRMRTENSTMRRELAGMRQAQREQAQQEQSRRAFDALAQEADQLRQSVYPGLDFGQLVFSTSCPKSSCGRACTPGWILGSWWRTPRRCAPCRPSRQPGRRIRCARYTKCCTGTKLFPAWPWRLSRGGHSRWRRRWQRIVRGRQRTVGDLKGES